MDCGWLDTLFLCCLSVAAHTNWNASLLLSILLSILLFVAGMGLGGPPWVQTESSTGTLFITQGGFQLKRQHVVMKGLSG